MQPLNQTERSRPLTRPAGRVLLVIPDSSVRVLMRAELIERGHDAVGAVTLADALACPTVDPGRGQVWLVLVDQAALEEAKPSAAEQLPLRFPEASVVLLASRSSERPRGPWTQVIERPVSIGEVASFVDRARKVFVAQHPSEEFELRMGPPWPAVFCSRCGASRHSNPPSDDAELYRVRVDLDQFIEQHTSAHGGS